MWRWIIYNKKWWNRYKLQCCINSDMSRMEVHSLPLSVHVYARARACVCLHQTDRHTVCGKRHYAGYCRYSNSFAVLRGQNIWYRINCGDLFKDYYNFTGSKAACSFYAVASRAVTFWSHLLEQTHQSPPLGPVVIKRNGEGQDTLALCSIHTFTGL